MFNTIILFNIIVIFIVLILLIFLIIIIPSVSNIFKQMRLRTLYIRYINENKPIEFFKIIKFNFLFYYSEVYKIFKEFLILSKLDLVYIKDLTEIFIKFFNNLFYIKLSLSKFNFNYFFNNSKKD
jgi:hypothetical protein